MHSIHSIISNAIKHRKSSFLAVMFAVFLPLLNAHAQDIVSDTFTLEESTAKLLVSQNTLAPNQDVLVGVSIKLAPHWHTYTYDPGDSGIPVSIVWTLPEGYTASEIYWPPHDKFNEAGLTTFGFSEQAVFTTIIHTPAQIAESNNIHAKVEYLVCKDICIPQTAEIALTLPSGDGALSVDAGLLQSWHDKSKLATEEPIKRAEAADTPAIDTNSIKEKAPHSQNETEKTTLLAAVLFALIGGLILNLMPCVFPVLSLKALAIAKHSELSHSTIRKEGIAYTLGVLSCFLALALILISLQQAGESIGWGFQFQSPAFVALMAILLLFIGLNLSGIFELPTLLGNVASEIQKPDSLKGSYFTGLLAALVATPCTAPFMATAVGAALSQPPMFTLTVFAALGLGLALPFLLLSYIPALLAWLPKPGAWMLTFKSFLAFPMYLSAIWLLWVVGTQTGIDGMTAVLAITVIILFLLWAKRPCKMHSRFCLAAHFVVILALLVVLAQGLERVQAMHSNAASSIVNTENVEPYSAARLQELRDAGTPVFVDATASWCITCQINKRIAIDTKAVQKSFNERGVVTLIADWTNKDSEITAYLSSFGYKGVPLYVYYAPHQKGKVLPQILTPSILLEETTTHN